MHLVLLIPQTGFGKAKRLNLLNTVEPRIAVQNNRFKFLRE